MSVLLPNASLGVRRRASRGTTDAHGYPVVSAESGDLAGPLPGFVSGGGETFVGEEDVYTLHVDPALWPFEPKDTVEEPATGRQWMVRTANLLAHSEDATVDYVRVVGQLQADTSGQGTFP